MARKTTDFIQDFAFMNSCGSIILRTGGKSVHDTMI